MKEALSTGGGGEGVAGEEEELADDDCDEAPSSSEVADDSRPSGEGREEAPAAAHTLAPMGVKGCEPRARRASRAKRREAILLRMLAIGSCVLEGIFNERPAAPG